MKNEKEVRPIRALSPVILAIFHGLLWIVLVGLMWRMVPSFEKIFIDFDFELPQMTILAIMVSNCVVRYFYLVPPFLVAFCWADLILLRALDRHPEAGVPRLLWLALMMFVPLGLMAGTVAAVYLPLISLIQNLS